MVTAAAAAVETLDSLKSKLDRGKEGERERDFDQKYIRNAKYSV